MITIRNETPGLYSQKSIFLAISAGIVYLLGILNMSTMALFAVIVWLILFIHGLVIRDTKELTSLFFHTSIVFIIFAPLYLILGLHHEGIVITRYTIGHILVLLALPLVMGIFTIFSYFLSKRPAYYYLGAVGSFLIAAYAGISVLMPELIQQIANAINYFFFFSYDVSFINEMQMWEPVRAWYSYNIAFFLAVLGIIFTLLHLKREYRPELMCILVWGITILYATIMHVRYEYYAGVVIVLFSSITMTVLYDGIATRQNRVQMIKPGRDDYKKPFPIRSIFVIGVLILIIFGFSIQTISIVTESQIGQPTMSYDWGISLVWLNENTPDSGVDYDAIYEKTNFLYPESAYGILSWWDYGHWITYLGQRIPISSPFQDNVRPVARFLSSVTEKEAEKYAGKIKPNYIITDYATVTT
ncbi:MAG: hypothetical protein AB2L10_00230, partial [Methanospirillum sp.]